MNYLLIIYIPIVLAILWAVRRTLVRSGRVDALLLLGAGSIVVMNGAIRHFVFDGFDIPVFVTAIQQLLSSLIVPLAYIFFSRQVGRAWYNETSILLLSFVALLLLPNVVIVADGAKLTDFTLSTSAGFRSLLYIGKDSRCYEYAISDVIIVLQTFVTLLRFIPTYHTIRKYDLSLSRDSKLFLSWWVLSALFIVFASLNSNQDAVVPLINATCHILFMLLVISIFLLLGKGFDLRPVLITKEDEVHTEEPVELSTFVRHNEDMAQKFHKLIDERHAHLDASFNADKAIAELGTNRTYFYRMIKTEFHCTFTEFLNRERVELVKQWLKTTDDSLLVIAERCGFSDASYMIKVFKRQTGITPNEWREHNDNQQYNESQPDG